MEFMPVHAPLVVLSFLGTCLALSGATALLLYLLVRRRHGAAKILASGIAVLLGLYFAVLLTTSLATKEKILEPGQLKYFCEIDCHVASIT